MIVSDTVKTVSELWVILFFIKIMIFRSLGLLLWLLVGFGVAVFINVWQFGLIMLSLFIVIIGGKFILNYVKNKKANNTYAS